MESAGDVFIDGAPLHLSKVTGPVIETVNFTSKLRVLPTELAPNQLKGVEKTSRNSLLF